MVRSSRGRYRIASPLLALQLQARYGAPVRLVQPQGRAPAPPARSLPGAPTP